MAPAKQGKQLMSTHVAISLDEIEDRVAIRELIEAYAHRADDRDVKGQMAPDRCRRKCPYRILCDGSVRTSEPAFST